MVHMGRSKRIEEFPMPPRRFVRNFYLAPLVSPWPLVRYGWAYIDLTVLGRGGTGHRGRMADGPVIDHGLRPATALGLLYLAGAIGLQWHLVGREFLWSAAEGLLGVALVAVVAYGLPAGTHPRSPARQPYSGRLAGVLRLGYYTTLLVILGRLHDVTGGRSTVYFVLLWILPFATTFLYFMWLRDVYQHANADDGRLTNSRIFRCDPFTRWAVFVYGQDLHVTHHLFPGIPHHRLAELHDLLTREHAGYATRVVECHGTFANRRGLPTILDVLAGAPNPARAAPSPGAETAEAGPAAS
jgi:hypothetical protein